MGFQVYGIEQNAIHVDGVYLDEALMQLLLPQEPSQPLKASYGASDTS